jgi:AAA+ superfamily predicted ATPase
VTDAGLGLRADVHRHGRNHRPLHGAQGAQARAKWGGQCIIFIDEIDAVGMRRNALRVAVGTAAR